MDTNNQVNRIAQAKAETQRLLNKELRYLATNQKPEYIASLRGHLAKLDAMGS